MRMVNDNFRDDNFKDSNTKNGKRLNINISLKGIFKVIKKLKHKGEKTMKALKKELTAQDSIEIKKRNDKIVAANSVMKADRESLEKPQQVFYINFKTSKLEHLVELEDCRELVDLGTF